MSAKDPFLSKERKNIEQTIIMLEDLMANEDLSKYEIIALGTLLQNAYTGIEGILRYQLQNTGVRLQKDENWHKDLFKHCKPGPQGQVRDRWLCHGFFL